MREQEMKVQILELVNSCIEGNAHQNAISHLGSDDDLLVANTNHDNGFGEFSEEDSEEDDSEEDDSEEESEDDDGAEDDIEDDESEEGEPVDDEQVKETARRLGNTVI